MVEPERWSNGRAGIEQRYSIASLVDVESPGRAFRSWLSGLLAVALGLIAIPTAAAPDAPSALTPALAPTSPSPPEPTTPTGTPASKFTPLPAPAHVTTDAADRRLTVSWRPVAGATSYKVAARPTNRGRPFAWRKYDTASPPYAITDPWAAMSGLEYEVRVATVNDDGRSIWSPSVAVTAPALRRAPADAIEVGPAGPYELGDMIWVNLAGQRPFTRRSRWIWSVCDPDGSDCELLPFVTSPSFAYLVGEAALGKRVQVQVDYDKDGSSWTATAVPGVVSREAPPSRPFPRPIPIFPPGCGEAAPPSVADAFTKGVPLKAHLHRLESKSVQISWDKAGGGAIEPLCNDLLVVTPWGRIALVRPDGSVAHLEDRVPMNLEGLMSHPDIAALPSNRFRVADILLKQRSEERWELFVTHHYFTEAEECVRFRLSSATVLRQGASVSVSRSWRTIFDAEPCVPVTEQELLRAGGRILADGPDHLLVVIGDHGREESAREPDSHLGKLVRIAIETGEVEILSVGLRNPQGFVRDADGNLWETEHGPQGGDELNLLEPGVNYGWPFVSYGVQYGKAMLRTVPDESTGRHAGFARPVFAWVPSIAVSAMIVNDERWLPLWKDDLLIGSLGNASRGLSIFRARRNGTNLQYVERIEVGYRVRDLTWMPDGRIATLADGTGESTRVHFLSRSSEYCDERSRRHRLVYTVGCGPLDDDAAQAPDADRWGRGTSGAEDGDGAGPGDMTPVGAGDTTPVSGAQLYSTHCIACHSLATERHGMGPHLVGVIGRRIGEAEGWPFSSALRSLDGVWTPESLARFLAAPRHFAPGTTMEPSGLAESEARAIADYIAEPRGG